MRFEIDAEQELTSSIEEAKKLFRAEMQRSLFDKITKFFRGETAYNPMQHIPGAGEEKIDEFITEKFCSDSMNAEFEQFFNENYKRIMEECMTRAIQHNFNRLAFARMRKEKISLKSL